MNHLNHENFSGLLLEFVNLPFADQGSSKLIEIAKSVWYGDSALIQEFSSLTENNNIEILLKKKAMYVLDTLRRYPCISTEKKHEAQKIISKHLALKESSTDPLAEARVKEYLLDKLAFQWGLSEDISKLMKDVLFYQTRHYAATQNVITGFNEDSLNLAS